MSNAWNSGGNSRNREAGRQNISLTGDCTCRPRCRTARCPERMTRRRIPSRPWVSIVPAGRGHPSSREDHRLLPPCLCKEDRTTGRARIHTSNMETTKKGIRGGGGGGISAQCCWSPSWGEHWKGLQLFQKQSFITDSRRTHRALLGNNNQRQNTQEGQGKRDSRFNLNFDISNLDI